MKKYYRIGMDHVCIDHETDTVYIARNRPESQKIEIWHNSPENVANIEGYKTKEEGGHKEEITEAEFQYVFSEVVEFFHTSTPFA